MDGRELRRTLDIHERIACAYKDDRFPNKPYARNDFRMFLVTAIWVVGIERPPKGTRWQRVADILNLSNHAFWDLIASDAPRYEPEQRRFWADETCPAPMIRRDGPCGQRGTEKAQISSPEDGTYRWEYYCSRHRDLAHQANAHDEALRKAGQIPEPLPNTGGLGPCYLRWNWPDQYAKARRGWKPPKVGICADDWPVMAKVVDQEPPTLAVLAGGGEIAEEADGPSLKVLRGGRRG